MTLELGCFSLCWEVLKSNILQNMKRKVKTNLFNDLPLPSLPTARECGALGISVRVN